ncbi:NUDIX domain-containing protein [Pontibacillus yanchengensis]|uniref:NUDIX domain-containing protein n=2 Tax=Pontibacillus yanchengensis TaxID=462910 RepID=A0ACC7VIB1_9BACI|nr:NUDIX hydrolase [Pontibacillus yanchengensis]MYL35619.1 NUDIX domain-containing protein [Pontibacillus yanchengensis]MYL53679.1 NUDIX domain-containing protein [Pontibacillus yanchengensis]
MKRVDVAYSLIFDEPNQKILMVRNKRGDSYDYSLPGGAVEKGETLEQAAIREAKEETGFDVTVSNLISVNESFFQHNGHHAIFFTFQGEIKDGEIHISRPNEIEDVVWMDLDEADLHMPFYKDGISTYIKQNYAIPYIYQGVN